MEQGFQQISRTLNTKGLADETNTSSSLSQVDLPALLDGLPHGQAQGILATYGVSLKNQELLQAVIEGLALERENAAVERKSAAVQREESQAKMDALKVQCADMQAELTALRNDNDGLLVAEKERESRREKRKQRQVQKEREVISLDEFFELITSDVFSRDILVRSRQRVCLGLLYITGCRVDDLRCLTVSNLEKMFASKNAHLRFYTKKTRHWHQAYLEKRGEKVLKAVKSDWLTLRDLLKSGTKKLGYV